MKHTNFLPFLVISTLALQACELPMSRPPMEGGGGEACPMICKIPVGTYDEYICREPLGETELARVLIVVPEDWQQFRELRVKNGAGDDDDQNVPVVDMYESWGHSRWFRGEGWSLEIPLGPEPLHAPPGYAGNLSTLTRPDDTTLSMKCEYKNNVPCESVCGQ